MNDSSSLDSVPTFLNTQVTNETETKRANPHSNVWQGSESACGRNVKLQNIVGVFGQISHHCVIAPIMTYLKAKRYNCLKTHPLIHF